MEVSGVANVEGKQSYSNLPLEEPWTWTTSAIGRTAPGRTRR